MAWTSGPCGGWGTGSLVTPRGWWQTAPFPTGNLSLLDVDPSCLNSILPRKIWNRSSLRFLPTCSSTTKAISVDDPRFWAGAWQRAATKKWFIRFGIISQQQHNEKRLWVTQYQNYIPYKSLSFVFLLGSNLPFTVNYKLYHPLNTTQLSLSVRHFCR